MLSKRNTDKYCKFGFINRKRNQGDAEPIIPWEPLVKETLAYRVSPGKRAFHIRKCNRWGAELIVGGSISMSAVGMTILMA